MSRGSAIAVFVIFLVGVTAWFAFERATEAKRLAVRAQLAAEQDAGEPAMSPSRRSQIAEPSADTEPVPTARLTGSVRDELTQARLIGATVTVVPFDKSYHDVLADHRIDAKVLPLGYFEVRLRREPGANHWIKASHPGYLPVVRWVQPSQFEPYRERIVDPSTGQVTEERVLGWASIDFALYPKSGAATVTCRVVDSSGRTVRSAHVVLRARTSLRPELGVAAMLEMKPDPAGTWASEPIRPGAARLTVTAKGFERLERELDLHSGANALGALVLASEQSDQKREPATLVGTIANAGGSPAIGARVVVAAMTADRVESSVADDGSYEVSPIVPGTHEVRVEADGFPTLSFRREFAPGATVEFHHRFAGEHFIGGMVTDSGKPIEGLAVTASRRHVPVVDGKPGPEARRRWRAETDSKGRFRLGHLPHGPVDLVLRWSKSTYRDLVVRGLAVDRDDYRLRFPLPRSVEVTGVVRDAFGAAIGDATLVPRYLSPSDRKRARSATNGAFRVSVAMSNQQALTIEVSKSGFRNTSRSFLLSEAESDGTLRWDPILYRVADLGVVAGTIRDGTGRPVANARVRAQRDVRSLISERCESDSQGRYRLVEVAPGPIELQVRHRDYELWTKRVEVERGQEQTVDVGLLPVSSAPLELAFLLGRAPLADARVTLIRQHPGRRVDLVSDATGSVRIDAWKTGETEIIVAACNRYPSQRGRIRHSDASAGVRRLEVRGGRGIVRGVVKTRDGHPVPSEIVVLREQSTADLVVFDEVLTDQDGGFLFASLPRSRFTIDVANDPRTRLDVVPDGRPVVLRTRY